MTSRHFFTVFVITGIGLVLRTYSIWYNPAINVDGTLYVEQAKAIFEGRFLSALDCYPYPTLYSLLIAASYPLFHQWPIAARAVSLVAWLISFFFSWKTASLFSKDRLGVALVMLYFVCLPTLVIYSYGAFRDPLAWALLSASYYWLFHTSSRELTPRAAMILSLVFLAAAVTRPEYIAFWLAASIVVLYQSKKTGQWMAALLFVAPFLIFMIISYLAAGNALSDFIFSEAKRRIDYYLQLRNSLTAISQGQNHLLSSYFLKEIKNLLWWNALGLFLKKTIDVISVPGLIFLAMGAKRLKKRMSNISNDQAAMTLILFLFTSFVILYFQAFTSWALTKRHVCMLCYILVPFLTMGVVAFRERLGKKVGFIIITFLILIFSLPSNLRTDKRETKTVLKNVGDIIRQDSIGTEGMIRVAGHIKRLNLVSFYANLKRTGNTCFEAELRLPKIPSECLNAVIKTDFDYYVWDEKHGPGDILKHPSKYGLKMIYSIPTKKYGTLVVFKKTYPTKKGPDR